MAELFYDRGNHYEFLSLTQELASPGEMRTAQSYDFEFKNVEKQYESYHGINVKLRYVLRMLLPRVAETTELIMQDFESCVGISFEWQFRDEWRM